MKALVPILFLVGSALIVFVSGVGLAHVYHRHHHPGPSAAEPTTPTGLTEAVDGISKLADQGFSNFCYRAGWLMCQQGENASVVHRSFELGPKMKIEISMPFELQPQPKPKPDKTPDQEL